RRFVMPFHGRPLLAVGDGLQPVPVDAERDEIVLHGIGAPLAQREVVFARAALVAVTFDRDAILRVLLQPCGLLLQRVLRIRANLVAVVVEEDPIADAHLELLWRSRCRLAGGRAGARSRLAGRRRFLARRASSEQQSGCECRNDLQVHLSTPYPCPEERLRW